MKTKLKTPYQLKCEKIRSEIIVRYEALAEEEASNWRKSIFIADKLDVSAGFVASVIKAHNGAQNEPNG